jgi:phosphate transport system permease protein
MESPQSPQSFTGRARRKRTTRFSVRVGDFAGRWVITVGGIGTILAVLTICVFLVWMVVPLFLPASIQPPTTFSPEWRGKRAVRAEIDEYGMMAWSLFSDGTLQVFRLDNGESLGTHTLFPKANVTAISTPGGRVADPSGGSGDFQALAIGFVDGTVQLGHIGFETTFLKDTPPELRDLAVGRIVGYKGGLVSRTPAGQLRWQQFKSEFAEPIKPEGKPEAVQLIDRADSGRDTIISVVTADGKLRTSSVKRTKNPITDEETIELTGGELTLPTRPDKAPPSHVFVSGIGDNVFLIWRDGNLVRLNTRDVEKPKIAEERNLLDNPSLSVTSAQFLLGRTSLLVGDSSGRVRVWFRVGEPGPASNDGATMVAARDLKGPPSAVTSLASSERSRLFAVGYADGGVRVFFATSEKFVGEAKTQAENQVQGLAFAPKEDGFMALTAAGVWHWDMNPRHPETTWRSLFLPVWYEGYAKPTFAWQTSSASDDYEPKFGFWPLIFGTLKATFYSLLIAVPLALMAAIYTSEFLEPRAKALVKPTIEMMASLPSVVLGFFAAIIFAPFVSRYLSSVMSAFLMVPVASLIGAYVWQFLPEKLALRLARNRFLFLAGATVFGLASSAIAGPALESLLFDGDLKGWLAGQHGSARSGWFVILFPVCAIGTSFAFNEFASPWVRRVTSGRGRAVTAAAALGRFCVMMTIGAASALIFAALLSAVGIDPRASLVGTYIERNALVVGFAMGFAVIPIIYTLAEDALSAVPEHLRAASLGCGATPWQTAHRIIIPAAMSGLFSAVMIGLGRAVGETMIVLMAAGNTPVLDLNIFNGFRTLAANIAVEMPEAPKGGTHYRTLFLAALLLFAMTFLVNTVAEGVRQRFRKRAFQL